MAKLQISTIIIFLLTLTLFLAGNFHLVSAENLANLSDYSIKLSISPSIIEEGTNVHPIGFVFMTNTNGVPITSDNDVVVELISDNPAIASVPNEITLLANSEFAKFDITSGISGDTVITATLNDKTDFKHIVVGTSKTHLPDDLTLELNLPTNNMHVYSEMPFSIYLKTSEGNVVRAPYDIEVNLEYEKLLAIPSSDKLVIKTGEYYAWGTITTNEKVGNTFLRAIQIEKQLDTVKNIQISSTLPFSLSMMVNPDLINADVNRHLDIFVSLLDSDGNPTVAKNDIPLKFFSNNQNFVGDALDDAMKTMKPVIKKGEFGYLFQPRINLVGYLANDIQIGVSAEGYGIAQDTFSTVGKSITTEDKRLINTSVINSDNKLGPIDEKVVQIFGPSKIPSNAMAIFSYQMAIVENDDDDPKEVQDKISEIENSKDILIYDIDYLEKGQLYPIQASQNYRSVGAVQLLDVISGDNSIVTIKDPGMIGASYSFGSTIVSTGQKSGEVTISVNVKGIGSNSFVTEVVNPLELKDIRLFSPTGDDSILIDRDGSFDIFLVAIDTQNRPKVLDKDSRYLVTPANEIIEIKKDTTFAFAKLQSDSFSLVNGDSVSLGASPIGENANISLNSTKTFDTQLSSQILVMFPINNPNIKYNNHVGIVQIADLQGNPITSPKDIKTKIVSSDGEIVQTTDVVIKKGVSYAEFPIETSKIAGDSIISASAKGLVGSNATLEVSASSATLKISTSGLGEAIPLNKSTQIKLFVDDENANSIEGAEIMVKSDPNSSSSNSMIRTGPDGSATFSLTALKGPKISLDLVATAEGYVDGKETLEINVDSVSGNSATIGDTGLPEWILFGVIGAAILVIGLLIFLLKKSKLTIKEESWEEEEI